MSTATAQSRDARLFVGGRALDGMDQNYLYFVVAQDGSFLIRKRAGDTLNFAVNEVVTARTST